MLTGIIYCENCGGKYTFIKGYKNSSYAICRNRKIYGNMICNCKSIKEDVLNNAVINSIKDVISKYANKDYILNNVDNKANDSLKNSLLKEQESLELKLSENNNIKFNMYKDKVNSVISKKDYTLFVNKINGDIESYENRIKDINETIENIDNDTKNKIDMLSIINKFFDTDSFDRNHILQLIDKIEICAHIEQPKIKIYFKFKNN
ncbi:MAG: zinc ribbon domain-containing protein [Clostridia bacterium]|nr:zinc ribbon domain-containing protein [Clostridia bacterium]